MKSIKKMSMIQFDITNVCFKECVNCTRLIGHHKKPFYMDLEFFERGIDSVKGYRGGVSIIGGEPLMHPEFHEICKILLKKIAPQQRYLFTSGYRWKEQRSIIKKTFADRVYYNAHEDPTQKHQPVLLAIDDVVADKNLVVELIDRCWLQRRWAAAINPKGCFFCEIAANLDLLFGGPGGYPVENGWWERTPEQFQDQIDRYCRKCGVALPLPPVHLSDKKDFVSIGNYKRLAELKTPRFVRNRVTLVEKIYTREEIAEYAKGWEPWEYKGERGRETCIYDLYGFWKGVLLRIHIAIRDSILKRRNVIIPDLPIGMSDYLLEEKDRTLAQALILALLLFRKRLIARFSTKEQSTVESEEY